MKTPFAYILALILSHSTPSAPVQYNTIPHSQPPNFDFRIVSLPRIRPLSLSSSMCFVVQMCSFVFLFRCRCECAETGDMQPMWQIVIPFLAHMLLGDKWRIRWKNIPSIRSFNQEINGFCCRNTKLCMLSGFLYNIFVGVFVSSIFRFVSSSCCRCTPLLKSHHWNLLTGSRWVFAPNCLFLSLFGFIRCCVPFCGSNLGRVVAKYLFFNAETQTLSVARSLSAIASVHLPTRRRAYSFAFDVVICKVRSFHRNNTKLNRFHCC